MNVHASALIRAPYPVSTPKNAIIARARLGMSCDMSGYESGYETTGMVLGTRSIEVRQGSRDI